MQQIRILLLLGFMISVSTVFSQHTDCLHFKTGKFQLLDASSPDYIITRNDSIQTETAKNSIVATDFYIRWIDDCNYELTLKKMHNRPAGIKMPDKTIKLFVKIVKISGDTCWVETKANTSDYISKKRMLKIKKIKQ